MFNQHPENGSILVHERLETEREKQTKWREKSVEGGKRSAEVRATKANTRTRRVVQPPLPNGSNQTSTLLSSVCSLQTDQLIEQIYAAYPRKEAPRDAKKAIAKVLKEGKSGDELLAITARYAAAVATWPKGDEKFIPYPATWFNRGSYDDDPATWERNGERVSATRLGENLL